MTGRSPARLLAPLASVATAVALFVSPGVDLDALPMTGADPAAPSPGQESDLP
ncbi:MAG: hypothetical protein ACR2NB_04380 [Solirubrobacteraceae bacterium]